MSVEQVDPEQVAGEIAELLGARTVATAESVTAGRIAQTFATVERASEFFRGGVVAYQEGIKRDLLGVAAQAVVSGPAAVEMAVGVARLLGADVAVATTGLAGGDPVDGKPGGT